MHIWRVLALVALQGCLSSTPDTLPDLDPPQSDSLQPDSPQLTRPAAECTEKGCAEFGGCVWDAEALRCRPDKDADCQLASVACEKMGACRMWRGECCVAGVADVDCGVPRGQFEVNWCKVKGLCTARDGVCQATEPSHCKASFGCTWSGMCALSEGRCLALRDADCQNARECETKGRCKARSGLCVSD